MPDLTFSVVGAEPHAYAVTPTVLFKLRIESEPGVRVQSMSLNVQLRLAANRRPYTDVEQRRLAEVFGPPEHWSTTLGSLLWTNLTTVVPAFTDMTVVDVTVPCTYDFDVVSAKYFHALDAGVVPLEFLFSGTVFYTTEAGLRVERIGWDKEARYALPAEVWRQAVDAVFPNSAWLRISRDAFARLADVRARGAFPSWEATLDELLRAHDELVTS